MIRFNSEMLTAFQAEDAPIEKLPLENRSDEWWSAFWHHMGLQEAQRIKEAKV